jgi:hypothetical protein
MLKSSIFLIFSCFFWERVACQPALDTLSVYETAKYLIIGEQMNAKPSEFETRFLPKIRIRNLNSNGFPHVQFLLLQYRGFSDSANTISDSEYRKNTIPHSCDFVIAVCGGIYFRLKGFINNDFYQFLEYYSENSDDGFLLKKEVFSQKTYAKFTKMKNQKGIFIEELDIGCYYKYFQIQQRARIELGNNFCSGSCIYNKHMHNMP